MSYNPRDLSLYGTCDSCSAQGAVLAFDNGETSEHFCPRCIRQTALYNAAFKQLELLLEQAVRAWMISWEGERRAWMSDLDSHFTNIGADLQAKISAEDAAAEDVRPVTLNAAD